MVAVGYGGYVVVVWFVLCGLLGWCGCLGGGLFG